MLKTPKIGLKIILLASFASLASSAWAAGGKPEIKLGSEVARGGHDAVPGVDHFLGIPYAAPPVGPLRWREPQPVRVRPPVLDATEYGPTCAQIRMPPRLPEHPHIPNERYSEDCLYLNVWKPAGKPAHPLPVIVWFHGGGLMFGSGSDPLNQGADLARKGVVFVTVNYRLGALGYLVLPQLAAESPHHVSGNYGLLDQIAALKWVRDNISSFGGDPHNVTITGFSAGSTSVNALQATPLARGLFERAIGHSTADMNPAAGIWHLRTVAQAEQYGEEYMKLLGATTLSELRAMPAQKLADAPPKFWILENDGYVFPGEIYDIFAAGKQTKVPVMAGATENEWTSLGLPGWIHPRTPEEKAEVRQLYGSEGGNGGQGTNDVVLWQMREWVRLNALAGVKNSYLWFFTHVPPAPPRADGVKMGAYHGAELAFAYHTQHLIDMPWSPAEKKLSDIMASYWVNFARTGDPNGPGLPKWPSYSDDQVMDLSLQPHPISLPRKANLKFFDELFARQRRDGDDNLPRGS